MILALRDEGGIIQGVPLPSHLLFPRRGPREVPCLVQRDQVMDLVKNTCRRPSFSLGLIGRSCSVKRPRPCRPGTRDCRTRAGFFSSTLFTSLSDKPVSFAIPEIVRKSHFGSARASSTVLSMGSEMCWNFLEGGSPCTKPLSRCEVVPAAIYSPSPGCAPPTKNQIYSKGHA